MRTSTLLLASFIFLICAAAFGQDEADKAPKPTKSESETRLNSLLAETKKIKTQVEQTAKFVKENVEKTSPMYESTFKSYVEVQSEFDQWIEFYVLEFNSSLKRKKHKMDQVMLDSLITSSIGSAQGFITNVNSQTNMAARGIPIGTIIGAKDYIMQAYDLFKEFRTAKEERQKAILEALQQEFAKYKLSSFFDL